MKLLLFFFTISLLLPTNPVFASAYTMIKADGSSTVFPITEAVSEEFQHSTKGDIKVTVGISGTGGGFKKFCRNEIDIQNASRPILKAEMANCKKTDVQYFELPIGFDAIAIVVNPKNTWMNSITADELKKIWQASSQNTVMKWSDVNPKWPNEKLKLFGAGSDSGTFDYFTEAVNGKSKSSRGDYTASEDDNTLVLGVSNDHYALGYLPLSYYEGNKKKLKLLGVVGGEKAPKKIAILPSEKTVIDGTYYPLSRPIFIYVNAKSYTRKEVKDYVDFYLKNAFTLIPQVNYVPLPKTSYEIGLKNLAKGKKGTVFGGEAQIGMTIEKILKKEASL